ncbi:zinc finger protein 598-like protein [Cinnamomum micranthum f. kanehirae]|uniref:RING-type E3 ubiquitin transferase n=1 Tax=Cinnamomum micranthum f. kanehirae TaxID=337451 RepID=A0A3S3N8F9_9MAGN|nr:zinc finger protein 598-like protein [Cinnamomum micranthum f. kanehirae]
MDDSCAVCAESLEWVAYGSCGHREVCSTCVVRLRFVLDDRRCCLCKVESATVFVTKALGDYTRMINDFSVFPSDATEGRVGSYWYHEDTQAFFDDVDHYKMIKAMCNLSCSICDKLGEEEGNDGIKRRSKFKSIEQLKGHLYHRHRMFMCSLCLEGRKIFICEQKLYTRAQLNQHINTGDSEVDGNESERGGFMGHPMCEFCRNPFYGDNELYLHMSTEHYTCHICQRQHPGQYEYYKNYDDLEIHFRQEHFLCENEACLAKKFIVFQSESEMKRHNAIEHGGHMSRSKRNAALQIPTSFRFRRSNEQDRRRGRGRGSHPDSSADPLLLAIQASFETATVDNSTRDSSSDGHLDDNRETNEIDSGMSLLESLTIAPDSEPPSRYLQAVSQSSGNALLEESYFPPLSGASSNSRQLGTHNSERGPGKKSMAARLRLRNKGTARVLNSAQSRTWGNPGLGSSGSSSTMPGAYSAFVSSSSINTSQLRKPISDGQMSSSSSSSSSTMPHAFPALVSSSLINTSQLRKPISDGQMSSSSSSSSSTMPHAFPALVSSSSINTSHSRKPVSDGQTSSGSSSSSQARPATDHGRVVSSSASSSWNSSSTGRFPHSVSAPNLVDRGSSNMVPASASENQMPHAGSQSSLNAGDVHTANKSLVDRIHSGLGHDKDKYSAFKEISSEYRNDLIDTGEYLSYVEQFGLSHLVLELARLCPDVQKQNALINAYNARRQKSGPRENGAINNASSKESKGSNKGKGKHVDRVDNGKKESLADSVIDTVRKLQANYKPSEELEVLSKDGYRAGKGKSKMSLVADESQPSSVNRQSADSSGTDESLSIGNGGNSKQQRKTSKFLRVRLGDGSASALLDLRHMDTNPERTEGPTADVPSDGLPVRGVWRNGGGQRLVARTQRDVNS